MLSTKPPPEELVARLQQRRRQVADHKQAIREHKEQLRTAAEELRILEAECQRYGIGVIVQGGQSS